MLCNQLRAFARALGLGVTYGPRRSRGARPMRAFELGMAAQVEALERRDLLSSTPAIVKDIVPGSGSSMDVLDTTVVNGNGVVFFSANDGAHGYELWKSNNTASGTNIVRDINPGNAGGLYVFFNQMVNVNGTMFFDANDGTHGIELWKSDGTCAGTVLVKDINPGSASAFGNYSETTNQLTNVGGTLYFTANDGTHGVELWKSNGTSSGTVMVQDIFPGAIGSSPDHLTNVSGTLYFTANEQTHGTELWKATAAGGATLVDDIDPGIFGSSPAGLTNIGGTLYFAATDGVHGDELWKSNATGTSMVHDIHPGSGSSLPAFFGVPLINLNGTMFFSANDGSHGYELWKSDGTDSGTVLVRDVNPGTTGSFSQFSSVLASVGNTVFFAANDGSHGIELWKTDGTSAGTTLVQDIKPGTASSSPKYLTNVSGTLYFVATSGFVSDVWSSNGTSGGTVATGVNGGGIDPFPRSLTNENGELFFTAGGVTNGAELWSIDSRIAPVLTGPSTLTYTKLHAPIAIDPLITVSDSDSPGLATATVRIVNFVPGQDVLGLTTNSSTMGNITASFNSSNGVLTLRSLGATATPAQFQAALRAVSYSNTSLTPNTTSRTVVYQVWDGALLSNTITSVIAVKNVNLAPVLSGTSTITFTTDGAAKVINTGVAVSDVDSAKLASATVKITNFVAGQDVLGFVANASTMGNITGSFNTFTGILTLTSSGSTATVAQFQTALRAVTYLNTSYYPNKTDRSVTFQVSDGSLSSSSVTSKVHIT